MLADFLFKFLVIGSAGTGKSCILHQFIENKCKYRVKRKILHIVVGRVNDNS
jgi:GTPase SAR1 family protein